MNTKAKYGSEDQVNLQGQDMPNNLFGNQRLMTPREQEELYKSISKSGMAVSKGPLIEYSMRELDESLCALESSIEALGKRLEYIRQLAPDCPMEENRKDPERPCPLIATIQAFHKKVLKCQSDISAINLSLVV